MSKVRTEFRISPLPLLRFYRRRILFQRGLPGLRLFRKHCGKYMGASEKGTEKICRGFAFMGVYTDYGGFYRNTGGHISLVLSLMSVYNFQVRKELPVVGKFRKAFIQDLPGFFKVSSVPCRGKTVVKIRNTVCPVVSQHSFQFAV